MDNLNEIFDSARKLAEMLLETDEGKALNDARYVFDGNEEAQKMFSDYAAYRQRIQVMANNDDISEEELEKENEIIAGKIKELQQNPVIRDLFVAEQNFNNIINHVMNVFNATLAGDSGLPSGCSGSCSTCGGCH
ncbi:MAG: YlbF family regulator [Firmicutes bacterium]|nr:YlbF family regulator [Bacillota bacterium]